ncbi:MAG TPA: hypothetical protein VMT81_03185 [Candidatus Paceibacterota bacterium]|nr:hypothetical protein [Candidatus Paceibacterota bacterium]
MGQHRGELWAVLIVVAVGAGVLVFVAARAVGQVLALQGAPGAGVDALSAETIGWAAYRNPGFGFSFQYPSGWEIMTTTLASQPPFLVLGNPLDGTSTYAARISIENNSSSLSSGGFVHQMLAALRAQDAENAKSGPAPQLAPRFGSASVYRIGPYDAYELSDVFEFDHDADQVYIADGDVVLEFDFPAAEENPNISLPVANNATIREIMETLTFG